jgi:hypothetical protein
MAGTVNMPVDMANLALAHLKEPGIQAFDGSNTASRWFRANYAAKRDVALARADWDFAVKLATLGVSTTTPPFRWKYQYKLPADCIRIPQQTEGGRPDGAWLKYEVIGNHLMTDEKAPFCLRYVHRVASEFYFPPLFIDAFSYLLAGGVAHVIASKNSLVQTMMEAATAAFDQAAAKDAMQSTAQPNAQAEILQDR